MIYCISSRYKEIQYTFRYDTIEVENWLKNERDLSLSCEFLFLWWNYN
jgi:hypothetical protein